MGDERGTDSRRRGAPKTIRIPNAAGSGRCECGAMAGEPQYKVGQLRSLNLSMLARGRVKLFPQFGHLFWRRAPRIRRVRPLGLPRVSWIGVFVLGEVSYFSRF